MLSANASTEVCFLKVPTYKNYWETRSSLNMFFLTPKWCASVCYFRVHVRIYRGFKMSTKRLHIFNALKTLAIKDKNTFRSICLFLICQWLCLWSLGVWCCSSTLIWLFLNEQLVSSYRCVSFTFQDIGKVSLVHMLQPSHLKWSAMIILFLLWWCLSRCSWQTETHQIFYYPKCLAGCSDVRKSGETLASAVSSSHLVCSGWSSGTFLETPFHLVGSDRL